MPNMTTTWKSLLAGFGLGVISTALFALGLHVTAVILWAASLAYIAYTAFELPQS